MVYLKSLSTKLISIYVSLFLVFSPLFGQTKQGATIYMTNGFVGSVTVIEIGEKEIEVEMYQDGQLLQQNLQKSMIYQIVSPEGEVLYRNPDFEEKFDKAYLRFKMKLILMERPI